MPYSISQDNIKLFSATFRGREDVFAIRWEKDNKGGYMPAYSFDPYMYKLHRMRGGTFQNYTDKQYLPLTDEQIHKHLKGEQLIGIYPLLKDNTTWFIAADFDGENWEKECKNCITVCFENGLPAYLERSRSGKGGHVWIFFEHPYPAFRIRKIFITLTERNGVFSVFDKHSSFDRLFPNQDYHSGKGLGNLIALPLHKPTYENGNSCFISPDTLLPIEDQWVLLKNIQKITVETLDTLYQDLIHKGDSKFLNETTPANGKVSFILRNVVSISRSGLSVPLITYLREELNFANSEYFVKKNTGKNTWDTKRFFKTIEETTDSITTPRGFVGKLIRFCKEHGIDYNFSDERRKAAAVIFSNSIQLIPNRYQDV